MTSKIIVNNIEADVGVSTITFGSNIQGNLIGNVTGTVNSSGIITASGFTGNVTGNITGNVNSSGVSTITTLQTGAIQTVAGKPILNSTGSILQVVQTAKTDTFSTSSGTGSPATITGFSASITPSSTSSKVLVYVHIGQLSGSSDTTWGIFMFRNGTKIFSGDVAGSRASGSIAGGIPSSGGTWRGYPAPIMYLDSPSSTTAVTYTFSLGTNGGAIVYFNQDGRDTNAANDATRTASSIILMEVSG